MANDEIRADDMRRRTPRWSKDREDKFIEILERTCNVSHAAAAAGLNRRWLYKRREADPAFALRWREAIDASFEELRWHMLERMRDGWTRTETRVDPETGKPIAIRTVHDFRPGPAVALLRLRQEEIIAMRRIEAEARAAQARADYRADHEAQAEPVRRFMDEIRARLASAADVDAEAPGAAGSGEEDEEHDGKADG